MCRGQRTKHLSRPGFVPNRFVEAESRVVLEACLVEDAPTLPRETEPMHSDTDLRPINGDCNSLPFSLGLIQIVPCVNAMNADLKSLAFHLGDDVGGLTKVVFCGAPVTVRI